MTALKITGNKYFDVSFFLKFVSFYVIFKSLPDGFRSLVRPGELYVAFLDKNLNFIRWDVKATLFIAQKICKVFGVITSVQNATITGPTNYSVRMDYACIGFGIFSVWTAFIIAYKLRWTKKLKWIAGGISIIWILNCFRMALLLMAYENHWKVNGYIDHHKMFNLVIYSVILCMVYCFANKQRKNQDYYFEPAT